VMENGSITSSFGAETLMLFPAKEKQARNLN
jgi:hypothetical protein